MRRTLSLIMVLVPLVSFCQTKSFMSDYFTNNLINGTIIIAPLVGNEKYVYNEERAKQPFLPASTFKIPNTLIALQEKVIKDEFEIIKWDSIARGPEGWNRDQTLRSAFKVSCVWAYQELANRIGNDTYLKYLEDINYGNHQTGFRLTSFWLNGDLRISAYQQIDFLKNVYLQKLPFDLNNYNILKSIMMADSTAGYIIYAKTGWADFQDQQTGWYVGYVEALGKVWLFACNLEIKDQSYLKFRKEIVYTALRELKIIY